MMGKGCPVIYPMCVMDEILKNCARSAFLNKAQGLTFVHPEGRVPIGVQRLPVELTTRTGV